MRQAAAGRATARSGSRGTAAPDPAASGGSRAAIYAHRFSQRAGRAYRAAVRSAFAGDVGSFGAASHARGVPDLADRRGFFVRAVLPAAHGAEAVHGAWGASGLDLRVLC